MASMVGLGLAAVRGFLFVGSIAAAAGAAGDANAQGKLDARYVASLAGIPIGKGTWVIDVGDDQYTAAASGVASGVMRVFANGQGSGASRGIVRGDTLIPTAYASSITNDKHTEDLHIALGGGTIKEVIVNPPSPPNPDRIPVTEAQRRGVLDPMSASLMRVPGNGDPVSAEACKRTIPIFDGRMRFDIRLSFKRMEKVHAEKGYQGTAVVCGMQFIPVSGYVPGRAAIKYLTAQRDMEITLAPIAGTRVMVPFRISVQTPLGLGMLEATQFATVATPRTAAR